MEIKLTSQESEEYFYNAMCNALGTGYFNYGEVAYVSSQYKAAKERLLQSGKNACYEDILLEILRGGGTLNYRDFEDHDMDKIISIKDVHERVAKTPLNHLMNMINENDDSETADCILQTVFFEEIIFG